MRWLLVIRLVPARLEGKIIRRGLYVGHGLGRFLRLVASNFLRFDLEYRDFVIRCVRFAQVVLERLSCVNYEVIPSFAV